MAIVNADCYRCTKCGRIGWVHTGKRPNPLFDGGAPYDHNDGSSKHDWKFDWNQDINTDENIYIG